MLLERVAPDTKVYLACGYTDMRMQIDGLASLVINQFQLDPSQNALFLFCGRRRDRIKGLLWEGDGFLLLYKRLESGVYQWPRTTQDLVSLDRKQYRWLLEGLTIAPRKKSRYRNANTLNEHAEIWLKRTNINAFGLVK